MKFIHTSDIHIGMSPDPTMPWSEERSKDIKETFADVIRKCKYEEADLLLISGDLFNHQPLTEELQYVDELFRTIPDTYVAIIAGSADHIKPNSPILNYTFSDNVFYFLDNTEFSFDIGNKQCIVHGFSYYSMEDTTPIINSITPDDDKNIHILLAYGGDLSHCPFDLSKLENKNFSYVALGSNRNFQTVIDKKAYYSGSPEPLDSNDVGDHGIIIGEINEHTRRTRNIKFESMSQIKYIPISIKVNGSNTEEDVVENVSKEVLKLGLENIYKIEITGFKNPDLEFSRDIFDKKIRIAEVIDRAVPKYDFVKLSSEHPQDMIGAFIRRMTSGNSELSEIEKKALYLGTHALIKTSDKSEN